MPEDFSDDLATLIALVRMQKRVKSQHPSASLDASKYETELRSTRARQLLRVLLGEAQGSASLRAEAEGIRQMALRG